MNLILFWLLMCILTIPFTIFLIISSRRAESQNDSDVDFYT